VVLTLCPSYTHITSQEKKKRATVTEGWRQWTLGLWDCPPGTMTRQNCLQPGWAQHCQARPTVLAPWLHASHGTSETSNWDLSEETPNSPVSSISETIMSKINRSQKSKYNVLPLQWFQKNTKTIMNYLGMYVANFYKRVQ
jgi:hypothetical protein